MRVQTYKVAVWATGGVGRFAIRTIVDRPNLELVGAWVHSASKDGADVGTLASIAPVGVRASPGLELGGFVCAGRGRRCLPWRSCEQAWPGGGDVG